MKSGMKMKMSSMKMAMKAAPAPVVVPQVVVPMKAMKMMSMKMAAPKPVPMKAAPKPMKAAPMKAMKMVMKAAPAPRFRPGKDGKLVKADVDYLKKLFKKADQDGDGNLSLKEFKSAATGKGGKNQKLLTAHTSKVGKSHNFDQIRKKK
ncbi:unnamed protein product [Amoebophrya sp. A25]|nr:unnamed protein product [Amoebophrya sp. A25]|eukprot:GSA25T00027688001.1